MIRKEKVRVQYEFQAQKNRLSAVYDITTYCFDYSVFSFPGTRGGT